MQCVCGVCGVCVWGVWVQRDNQSPVKYRPQHCTVWWLVPALRTQDMDVLVQVRK